MYIHIYTYFFESSVPTSHESYANTKKVVHPFCLHTCEKRPEPYYNTKRALSRLQMSPIHTPKEPYEDTKRALSGH